MIFLVGTLSLLLAIVTAAYLQLPTFLLFLGYSWFHNYFLKRWIIRMAAILCFALFLYLQPGLIAGIGFSIPFAFFMIFSLVNANPKVYIALSEQDILKKTDFFYPDATEVLGYVDSDGNAICYPLLEMIKPRHLLNDVFAGKPLLISYCMACRSAMVYHPVVDGQRLTFDVLGVYRRNMVMCDRETGTVWQQGTGEAVCGKHKGKRLELLPYQQTTVSDWNTLYPNTLVTAEAATVRDGIFSKDRLMKMMKVTETLIAPGKTNLSGLPPRTPVFGIELKQHSRAYPLPELLKTPHFTDIINGQQIEITYNVTSGMMTAVDVQTSEQLVCQSHWWFGWKEFHPATTIWNSPLQ